MKIFFAGSLTDLKNPEKTKAFYVRMADMAKEMGFEYFWAFLSGTDPIKDPEVLATDVYHQDIGALDRSDMMVAYVGEPSTGTGLEIEHAHQTNKPIIILYEQGKQISRMLRGCPGIVKEIIFTSQEDALNQLKEFLKQFSKT